MRRLVVSFLEPEGHNLLVAHDGHHAFNISQTHAGKIDLLITNVNMPEMSGHELASKIKETGPDIRIIMVSSDKEENFPSQAAHAAFVKPVDQERLINKVRELLAD